MTQYFVSYFPYTNDISRIYYVIGETEKYYKIKSTTSDDLRFEYLNKHSLYIRGSDIHLYRMEEKELQRKIKRQRNIILCEKTKWKTLTDEQLEKIRKILEEGKCVSES